MTTYKGRISVPDIISSFFQEIQGVASVTGVTDQHVDVEFDETSLYDLGVVVTELVHTLRTLTMEIINVSVETGLENGEEKDSARES